MSIFARLSNGWRSKSEVGRKGVTRRAISVMLENGLNITSPAAGRRDARSTATAAPSDRPATMIRDGATSVRVSKCS